MANIPVAAMIWMAWFRVARALALALVVLALAFAVAGRGGFAATEETDIAEEQPRE